MLSIPQKDLKRKVVFMLRLEKYFEGIKMKTAYGVSIDHIDIKSSSELIQFIINNGGFENISSINYNKIGEVQRIEIIFQKKMAQGIKNR